MPNYTKQLQNIVRDYRLAGHQWPAASTDVAAWAVHERRWQPQRSTLINQCATQLSRAMRDEHITDPQGRTIRVKHVVRKERDGKQAALWDDIRTAPRKHIQLSFQQRRSQIVGNCTQLKNDMDSYNENWNSDEPIQMSFNFTLDLEEAMTDTSSHDRTTKVPAPPLSEQVIQASAG